MSSRVEPPTDNPPPGSDDRQFSQWAIEFSYRKSAELMARRIPSSRIRDIVDLEVNAARARMNFKARLRLS